MATKRTKSTGAEPSPGAAQPANQTPGDNQLLIPVIQEEIRVDKRVVESGKVRISKRISEHEELVDVPLMHEEVSIERVQLNLFVEAMPPVRQEGDTMVIPVVREEIVIQKRLLLVEELRVRKQLIEEHKPQPITLRREEVEIIRTAGRKNSGRKS